MTSSQSLNLHWTGALEHIRFVDKKQCTHWWNAWTKNGHEYEIVQSVWVIEMQVTLLHLSYVLFFQSQEKEDFF